MLRQRRYLRRDFACMCFAFLVGTAFWQPAAAAQTGRTTSEVDRPLDDTVVTGDFISAQSIDRRRVAPNFRNVFDRSPLEVSVVWNFTGEQLVEILDAIPQQGVAQAGDGNFDIFQDDRSTLDFRASYKLLDRYTLFVSAENLTEEPRSFFEGRPENQGEFVKETTTWWL